MVEHNQEKILLHVGSGPKNPKKVPAMYRSPEWREVRLDVDENVGPDVTGDIRDMLEVENDYADALLSSHNLEHLYAHEVPAALSEFHRVLKPGGHALIACPDLQVVAEIIAKGNLVEPIYSSPAGPISPIDILYGYRPSLERGNHFMAHRTGFTAQTLAQSMAQAGFVNVKVQRISAPQFELVAQGFKIGK